MLTSRRWDTTGNMIEHYADGDLVNKDTPVGYGAAGQSIRVTDYCTHR